MFSFNKKTFELVYEMLETFELFFEMLETFELFLLEIHHDLILILMNIRIRSFAYQTTG